jgi:hypothetical protein
LEAEGFTLLDRFYGNKETLLSIWSFLIKDGSRIYFWEDSWLGNAPLQEQYPVLYNTACNKSDKIIEMLGTSHQMCPLDGISVRFASWQAPQERLSLVLENGWFSVGSMYKL